MARLGFIGVDDEADGRPSLSLGAGPFETGGNRTATATQADAFI